MAPHHSLFFFFFFFLMLISPYSAAASPSDTITAGQSLSGGAKLVSAGGNFELGFFQPGSSPYFYIGIWYNLSKVHQLTPVWVANRATPISDRTTTKLQISPDGDGNLVLSNQSNPLIWSTNFSMSNSDSKFTVTVAVLLDSGNLVVKDGPGPNSTTLWQSFDNPTHTFLPGGKLGLNKVTGYVQRLVSWTSLDDPAPGLFTFQIDPRYWLTNQYIIFWNDTDIYWTSGNWDRDGHIFSMVPEMTSKYIYDFSYVSNAKENYFIYSVKREYSIFSRFIMDVSGQIKQLTWVEKSNSWMLFWSQAHQQCQVHALCGPFGSCNENALPFCSCVRGFRVKSPSDWALSNWAGGCERNTPLQCGGGNGIGSDRVETDRFHTMSNMRLPDNAESLRVGSAAECESGCLRDCSCTAYSYDSNGCLVWYGDLLNLQDQYQDLDGGTVFLRLAASELPDSESNKGVPIGAIAAGVAAGLGMLVIVWLLIWQRRRRRIGMGGGLVAFRYGDLQRVTKNFSKKLGGGSFGSVFKGVLADTTEIAVKRLEGLRQGEKQFRAEVSTIGTIQHVNLVRLRGFCSQGIHRMLVYEYMPNGSLDTQLFFEYDSAGKALDWRKRYQIALGTARGLTYLHEQCRDCILHCDIKPENILLDASFVPKVADFGLAKLVGRDFSRVLTTMRGTIGYLAPEWISGVAITAKADVYSYGMMMFEIISGKRNIQHSQGNKCGGFFPILAANKLVEGGAISLLDSRLAGNANVEEVIRACKVACWCIQDDENSRPTMGQVVQILEGVLEVNMPPIPRALQLLAADNPGDIVFFSELSSNHTSKIQSTTSTTSQMKGTSYISSKD